MKAKLTQALWGAAWIAAAAAGWYAGRPASSAADGASSKARTAAPLQPDSVIAPLITKPARPAAELIAAVRAPASGDPLADRLRLLALIESLSVEELQSVMPRLYGDRAFRVMGMHQWARKDPAGAFDWLQTVQPQLQANIDPNGETSAALFREWARQDPTAAHTAAMKVRLEPMFENALWSVVATVMQTDPGAAMGMASGVAMSAGYERVNGREITDETAGAFIKGWGAIPEGQRFDSRFEYIVRASFSKWCAKDPLAAMEWTKSQSDSRRVRFLPEVLEALSLTAQKAAMDAFGVLPPSPEREKAGPVLAARMAEADPAGALQWIQKNLAAGRSEAAAMVARGIARKDPQQAVTLLKSMDPGPSRDAFIASTAAVWAGSDLTAAAVWAQSFAPGGERVSAINAIADKWISKDPASFAQFAATAPSAEVPEHLLGATAQALSKNGPQQAVTWIMGLSRGRADRAMTSLIGGMTSREDSAGLTAFIGRLPAAAQQVALQHAVANFAFQEGPPAAWLKTVAASPVLKKNLTYMLPSISYLDAAKRTAWLNALKQP
jgi:hypothetical protein